MGVTDVQVLRAFQLYLYQGYTQSYQIRGLSSFFKYRSCKQITPTNIRWQLLSTKTTKRMVESLLLRARIHFYIIEHKFGVQLSNLLFLVTKIKEKYLKKTQ